MQRLCEHVHIVRVYDGKKTYAAKSKYVAALNVVTDPGDPRSCEIVGFRGDLGSISPADILKFNSLVALYGGYNKINSERIGWRTFKITNCMGG